MQENEPGGRIPRNLIRTGSLRTSQVFYDGIAIDQTALAYTQNLKSTGLRVKIATYYQD